MSMWTNYTQSMPAGVAGGLYDLTEHVVDSRMNEAAGLMFLLAFYVLRENFGGFFGKLGPLFGKLVREPTSPMTPNDTDILTQRNSEN